MLMLAFAGLCGLRGICLSAIDCESRLGPGGLSTPPLTFSFVRHIADGTHTADLVIISPQDLDLHA